MSVDDRPINRVQPAWVDSPQRRAFLSGSAGALALRWLFQSDEAVASGIGSSGGEGPHAAPKAKRVIYLFQAGAPSQVDTLDAKPGLTARLGEEIPTSVRGEQRLTGMTSGQKSFPIAPSPFKFDRCGSSGAWLSETLPHLRKHADRMCIVRSVFTEAINHDPATTLMQTGHQLAGRPSFGSWLSYGLGSLNRNLPSFVVLISRPSGKTNAQPLHERMWGSGFLPSEHQGVRFSPGRDPVLYLSNPDGVSATDRRAMLDDLGVLNRERGKVHRDPAVESRIAQYELAFRMQSSVPELADLSREPDSTFDRYGPESRKPGTFAANCVLARRLAERDVRFIQLYHRGWDQHTDIRGGIPSQCYDTDQPSAALLADLEERGLLEDTLVVWGGEFGRTVFSQGKIESGNFGRDHQPSLLLDLAGGWRRATRRHLRRDGRLLLQHREGSRARSRPACHAAPPAGIGPQATDLQDPGERLSADRCFR